MPDSKVCYIHYRPGQWFITQKMWDRDLQRLEEHIAKRLRVDLRHGAKNPEHWAKRLEMYKSTKPGLHGTPDGRGGSTFAYEVLTNADGSPDKITYAVAICSYKDNYSKVIGRLIAKGRLYLTSDKRVVITYDASRGTVPEQILRDHIERVLGHGAYSLDQPGDY